MKSELKNELIKEAKQLELTTEGYNKAWLVAASVYIHDYILPVIKGTEEDFSNLSHNFLLFLSSFFKEKTLQETELPLPTRKVFLSVQRLQIRLSKPSRSVFSISDYIGGNKTSQTSSWKSSSVLLIGFFTYKNSHIGNTFVFQDDSAEIICSYLGSLSCLQCVVLLKSWNFIPFANQKGGYLEILEEPIILLKTNINLEDDQIEDQLIGPDKAKEMLTLVNNNSNRVYKAYFNSNIYVGLHSF